MPYVYIFLFLDSFLRAKVFSSIECEYVYVYVYVSEMCLCV